MIKKSRSLQRTDEVNAYLSILPVLLVIIMIKGYPILVAIMKSFTKWDGFAPSKYIGLANYINIIKSGEFWVMLRNNAILLLCIPLEIFVGSIVAVLLYEKVLGWKIFRAFIYLPQIVSTIVTGYIFAVFFGYRGPLNKVLELLGMIAGPVNWFGNWYTSLFVIILCIIWIDIGFQSILLLSGMSTISPSIYEAAIIDGAGYWQRLFKITLPMLTRTIEYSSVISVMWIFTGLFPIIYSITRGGPGYDTTTVDYMIYLKAFASGTNLGSASAVAVILLVIVIIMTKIQMSIADKVDDWSD